MPPEPGQGTSSLCTSNLAALGGVAPFSTLIVGATARYLPLSTRSVSIQQEAFHPTVTLQRQELSCRKTSPLPAAWCSALISLLPQGQDILSLPPGQAHHGADLQQLLPAEKCMNTWRGKEKKRSQAQAGSLSMKKTPVCVPGGCSRPYPPAPVPALLLLLLQELDAVGGRRGGAHAAHHLDAVLRQGRQPQLLPLPHLHRLQGFKSSQRELGDDKRGDGAVKGQGGSLPGGSLLCHAALWTEQWGIFGPHGVTPKIIRFWERKDFHAPGAPSRAGAAPSSWGSGERGHCRTWSPS